VAVGHLPITEVLVNLGKDMGYEVTVMSPLVDATKFQRADRVVDHLDFSKLDIRRDTAIVVASHANYDEEALESALATEAAYVSLVASEKRAADVIQYLRESHVPEEQLSRLKNPAGIDLGGSTPLSAAGPHPIPLLSAPSLLARELPRADGSRSPFRLRSLSPSPASADPPKPWRRRAGDFFSCGLTLRSATASARLARCGRRAPAGGLRTPVSITRRMIGMAESISSSTMKTTSSGPYSCSTSERRFSSNPSSAPQQGTKSTTEGRCSLGGGVPCALRA
jgi:hypothetical protein